MDIITEGRIQNEFTLIIEKIKLDGHAFISFQGIEFLEWFFDRKLDYENEDGDHYIELHKDITEEELEQLEQFLDYLRL